MAEITSDQLDLLREAHYEGSAYLIAGPQSVVFAARVNGTPAGNDFAQINYDDVTTGDYEALIVDMDVRISHTSNIRDAYFYGRIRKSPTSSILYINETSAAIADNDFLFIVDNYPMVIRQRYKDKVDWDRPVEALPPIESNVDSAYVVCTRAATATFSLSSIGQAMEKGESIASVEWVFTNVTVTAGDVDSADVTIEVETPYNAWAHEILTDTNGTVNVLHFTITAGDPENPAHDFFRLCHDDVPVSSDWENGYSASTRYRDEISDLLNRTRITLVSVETFDGDELGTDNIRFVGYLDSSNSTAAGDTEHGQRKDAQIEFSGLMQLAGKLRFNPIAIRHATAPARWDFINVPTPPRNITHLFAHHSTFLNLCSMDFAGIGETYLTGNVNVEESSLTDAARKSAKEINAYLVQSPAGKVTLVRDPRVGSNTYRSTIPDKTPEPIDLGDVKSYKLTREAYDKVGWMDVGFMVVHPANYTPTFITANAPASGPGDGQEDSTNPSQLLASTSNLTTALTEARQRTGDLFALANARRVLEKNFGSGWGSVIQATPGAYYQFFVAGDDDVRGYGIDAGDDWLCLSVNMTINRNGTQDTIGTFAEVTRGGNALIAASISPSVVNTPLPILPTISPYPAIPMPASINYDSLTPDNTIAGDPFSGMQTLPIPTEDAAHAAQNQPKPGESRAFTYFSYASNVTMGFTTVLGEDYPIEASGSAQISSDAWGYAFPVAGLYPDWTFPTFDGATTTVSGGKMVGAVSTDTLATFANAEIEIDAEVTSVTIHYEFDAPNAGDQQMKLFIDGVQSAAKVIPTTPGMDSLTWTGSESGVKTYNILGGIQGSGGGLYIRVTGVTFGGPGTNPFTGDPGGDLFADALYQYQKDDEGKPINVQAHSGRGLYINNAAIGGTLPPFNENSIYGLSLGDFNSGLGGDGNPIQFRFEDDNYVDNERLPLNLVVKGPGTGT